MAEAHEIIDQVQDEFKNLARNLARLTGKTAEWFLSHAREWKKLNPLQTGNASPLTHYFQYARQCEAAERGAGKMLNRRAFDALETEFAENGGSPGFEASAAATGDCAQKRLHASVLKESFDVLKCLGESDLTEKSLPELAAIEEEGAQLRDAASDFVSHVRAVRKIRESGRSKKSTK